MNRRRHNQMRSPFKQGNTSSSSLEGMERPIRSFKSFIKTVPPNPSHPRHNKPLPPTPKRVPSTPEGTPSPPTSVSPGSPTRRTSRATSWRAPAEWSTGSRRQNSLPSPPISASRQYSPLLPEPSPELTDKYMEIQATPQGEVTPPQRSRLLPIYERTNPGPRPSHSPPRSPLPRPPKPRFKPDARGASLAPDHADAPPPAPETTADHVPSTVQAGPRVDSPAHSTTSKASNASTKEKAFASMGIDPPAEQPAILANGNYRYLATGPPESSIIRPDRQYLEVGKHRALNDDGKALGEARPEDLNKNENTRQMGVLQDYHGMSVDAGRKTSVGHDKGPRDVPQNLASNKSNSKAPLKEVPDDRHLVPRPLSWRKGSSANTSRSASQTRNDTSTINSGATSSTQTRKRLSGKISAWVPLRLSVGPKRSAAMDATAGSDNGDSGGQGVGTWKRFGRNKAAKSKNKEDSSADKALDAQLRFSTFFPLSKSKRPEKKPEKPKGQENASASPMPDTPRPVPTAEAPTPLMRLPVLGISVIRTPTPAPSSDKASTHSTGDQARSVHLPESAWTSSGPHSPTSNPSERRYSYNTQPSPSAYQTLMPRNPFRVSTGSSRSQQSRTSNHPLSQEIEQSPQSPSDKSATPWSRRSEESNLETRKQGFLDKAMEFRRHRNKELRHDKLKKSIRVLGPTDPTVVEYINREGDSPEERARMPGYMVSGPA